MDYWGCWLTNPELPNLSRLLLGILILKAGANGNDGALQRDQCPNYKDDVLM